MAKIEVGMLVRISDKAIVHGRNTPSPDRGHIGVVVSDLGISRYSGNHLWKVEGSKHNSAEYLLIPIKPDAEPCDEDFAEDLRQWLNQPEG